MSSVHASRGPLEPASPYLRSEVAIVAGIARATLRQDDGSDRHHLDWDAFAADYGRVREHIARVVPGCEDYTAKVDRPGGFVLPHPPRDSREFRTRSGLAEIAVSPVEVLHVPDGHLLLQTLRSHDQFNTPIYGFSDRYRGIEGGRRVVFVHPDDVEALGLADGAHVDLVTRWDDDDVHRVAPGFRVVPYDTPRGTAAAYYPETNPLVPLDSTAEASNTPTSKSVVVRLVPAGTGAEGQAGETLGADAQDASGEDQGHHARPDPVPEQLS